MANQKWGYKPNGAAKIFDLDDDEGLPDGWSDTPDVIEDPEGRTAEALSDVLKNPIDDDDFEPSDGMIGEVKRRPGRPRKVEA